MTSDGRTGSPPEGETPMLALTDVRKDYPMGRRRVQALRGITLSIAPGEFVSVMGPSGSGKSTLLNLMGGLDHPTKGNVLLAGKDLAKLSDDELTSVRRHQVGFVFQFFNLMPALTAMENAALPLLLGGVARREAFQQGEALLSEMGLSSRFSHRPDELSGGEIQRVAIARALVTTPKLVLADEPTGNLDTESGDEVLAILARMAERHQTAVVMVTHDPDAAAAGQRIVRLRNGLIEHDG